MKNTITFLLVLFIVAQLNAQSEKYAIKLSNELVNYEQSMRDKRDKMRLKYHQEKDIYKTHPMPNQDKQYKQPLLASVSKTVNCTAGNLSTLLTANELNTVTDLTITGTIDARDFKTMRDNMPILSVLNINSATIVQYTGIDGTESNNSVSYPANTIPNNAFCITSVSPWVAKQSLTSITLPSNLTSIGVSAFALCSNIKGTLQIPPLVTNIGQSAFENCEGFTGELIIPSSVKKIEAKAFAGCWNITGSLIIPNSVIEIGESAFQSCGFNGTLTLGSSVTKIRDYAFCMCQGFTGSLVIPNSVQSIGKYAFFNCTGFNGTLTFGTSITSIGIRAFNSCTGFTGSLTIPNSVTQILDYAFEDCKGFNGSLTISTSLPIISEGVFKNCVGFIGSLNIPSSVYSISNDAFCGCSGFNGSLSLGSSLSSIGEYAFFNCNNLTGTLEFPSSITNISNRAFFQCYKIITINISSNNNFNIGRYSFSDCGGFFNVDVNNINYSSKDGVLFSKDETILIQCPNSKLGDYNIPTTVSKIRDGAFFSCKLSSVNIPFSVNEIELNPFQNINGNIIVAPENNYFSSDNGILYNKNKTSILALPSTKVGEFLIPNNVTNIGFAAFSNCSKLNTISIPESITSIQGGAFWRCTGLTSLCAYSKKPIDLNASEDVFYDVNTVECVLYVPASALTDYKQAYQWGNFANIKEIQSLSVSVNNLTFLASRSSGNINILTNINWTASSNQPWLTISPTSGTGNTTITLTAEENSTTAERTAIVTVSATGVPSQTITVTQQAVSLSLSVSTTSISVAKEANSSATVGITSNTSWIASSNQNWLTVSPVSGTGNANITFTAEENSTTAERTATVTVSATGVPSQTITVKQASKTTSIEDLSDSPISIYPNPANQNVTINGFDGIATVEILNIHGELKMKFSTVANKSISLETLPKGLYVIMIKTSTDNVNRKLIVE